VDTRNTLNFFTDKILQAVVRNLMISLLLRYSFVGSCLIPSTFYLSLGRKPAFEYLGSW
jgi:hypothetical protein